MSYQSQLQLKFHLGAFATKNANTSRTNLALELISVKDKAISPIASLVLQSLHHHLSTIQQSTVTPKQLLHFISSAWDRTLGLENEARMLEFCGVTRLTLSNPTDALRARCTLLGNAAVSSTPGRKGAAAKNSGAKRIDVDFTVRTCIVTDEADAKDIGSLDFEVDVLATKVYGFGAGNKSGLSGPEMKSILGKGLAKEDGGAQLGNGVWYKAVRMLTGSVLVGV